MNSNKPHYSIIDHTADLGLRVCGETLEQLFEAAAGTMIRIMVKAQWQTPTERVRIQIAGRDLEDLLVRWLSEILYYFEGEKKIAVSTKIVSLSPQHLEAILKMIPYEPHRHEILSEIKGVTYHQIEVSQKHDMSWEAKVIFDL